MWIQEEIVAAINKLELNATEVAKPDLKYIFDELTRTFAEPGNQPLWERLKERTSIRASNGWRKIHALVIGRVLLLVEDSQGRCGFEFQEASDLELVLEETSGFVFYVTNPELTYIISFNDHDVLIGSGSVSIK